MFFALSENEVKGIFCRINLLAGEDFERGIWWIFVDRQKPCHGLMGGRHLKSMAFVCGITTRNHRKGGRSIGKEKYRYLGRVQRGYEAIPGGH